MSDPSCRITVFSINSPFGSREVWRPNLRFSDIPGLDKDAAFLCSRRGDGASSVGLLVSVTLRAIFPENAHREGPVFVIAPLLGKSFGALVAACSVAHTAKRRFVLSKPRANVAPGAIIVEQSTADVCAVDEFVKCNEWTRNDIQIRCLKSPWRKDDLASIQHQKKCLSCDRLNR